MLFAKLVVHLFSFFILKKMFEGFSDIELERVFYLYTMVLLFVVTWCLISFAGEPTKAGWVSIFSDFSPGFACPWILT